MTILKISMNHIKIFSFDSSKKRLPDMDSTVERRNTKIVSRLLTHVFCVLVSGKILGLLLKLVPV